MNDPERHIIDDDDLLIDWSVGDLSERQRLAIIDHMAECSSCRQEIAKMVQAKAIVLPELHEPAIRRRTYTVVASLLAVAAAFLVVIFLPDAGGGSGNASRVVAVLEKDLAAGRFEDVIGETARLLMGQDALTNGERARLVNLQIQAERGETRAHSLTGRTLLVRDYGYEADGIRRIKDPGFPQATPAITETITRLRTAVKDHPDSIDLRLNLGQILLEQRIFGEAEKEFAEAVQIEPSNALAETGLGLALYQQEKPKTIHEALAHFRRAVELEPDNADARQNLAVCLKRLAQE